MWITYFLCVHELAKCLYRTQVHNAIKNVLVVFGYDTMEGVTSCKAVSFRQSIIVSGDMRRLKNDSLMSTIFYQQCFFSFQAVFWRDAPATTDTTATTTTTEDIEGEYQNLRLG